MADPLDVDGVPLDDLLPPPTTRAKRKEPNQVLDAENRLLSGMATAIQPTNKGYQMLMKMGFQPETGHSEPLAIELRKGRAGLGAFEEIRAKDEEHHRLQEDVEIKRRKEYEEDQYNFQQNMQRQGARRQVATQLYTALKLCYHLRDERLSNTANGAHEDLALHDDPPPLVADEQLKQAFHAASGTSTVRSLLADMSYDVQLLHLDQLNRYLREDFCYCFWCAHSYESQQSMNEHCPGATEEAHLNARAPTSTPSSFT